LSGSVYRALGKTALHLKVATAQSALIVASFMIGVNWGIIEVAFCYALANLMILYPHFRFVLGTIGTRPSTLLLSLSPQLIASGTMACAVLLADMSLLKYLPDILRLIGGGLVGAIFYVVVMVHIDRVQLTELAEMLGLNNMPIISRLLRVNILAASSQLWR